MYNASLMVLLWNSLATRDVRLMERSLAKDYGVPDDAVTAGLEAIIAGIREHLPETAVLVQSIYPVAEGDDLWYTGHIRAVNERLEELAAGYGCRYVDVYSALCAADGRLDSRYSDDGLHPNDAGYRAACPLVAAAIRETGGR